MDKFVIIGAWKASSHTDVDNLCLSSADALLLERPVERARNAIDRYAVLFIMIVILKTCSVEINWKYIYDEYQMRVIILLYRLFPKRFIPQPITRNMFRDQIFQWHAWQLSSSKELFIVFD